ncbi:MAG: hypothetical protein JXM79_08915 [Sedimentisphaerales bacterium]|nr:hypothetical protein [Sedimentisphaerales bacterium]
MESLETRLKLLIDQLSSITDRGAVELEHVGPSSDRSNTIRKQLQAGVQELKNIDHQLNDEVASRKRIEKALEATTGELKDFIYMTSHDFREPLRKIASFGAILKESLDGKIGQEDQENLDFMIDGAERMNQMIEELLAYSRINTRTIVLEKVDVNEIIKQLEQLDLGKPLEETGIPIEIPEPLPHVQADPVLVRQLLRNLMIHAIEHRGQAASRQIVIRSERIHNDEIKIECEMNGICTEAKNNEDPFKMSLHSHSRQEYEEAGTGLAICKKIVERHGGRIGITPKAETGSILWFTLPVSKHLEPKSNTRNIDPTAPLTI